MKFFTKVIENNPNLLGAVKRLKMVPPSLAKVGSKKTSFVNFRKMTQCLNRDPLHFKQYLENELGTTSSVDQNSQLLLRGRFQSAQIENVIRNYCSKIMIGCWYEKDWPMIFPPIRVLRALQDLWMRQHEAREGLSPAFLGVHSLWITIQRWPTDSGLPGLDEEESGDPCSRTMRRLIGLHKLLQNLFAFCQLIFGPFVGLVSEFSILIRMVDTSFDSKIVNFFENLFLRNKTSYWMANEWLLNNIMSNEYDNIKISWSVY